MTNGRSILCDPSEEVSLLRSRGLKSWCGRLGPGASRLIGMAAADLAGELERLILVTRVDRLWFRLFP